MMDGRMAGWLAGWMVQSSNHPGDATAGAERMGGLRSPLDGEVGRGSRWAVGS